jgi:hypothetical protein
MKRRSIVAKKRQALVTERKYQGKYVAFSPSEGKKIIAFGRDPGVVIQKARRKGVSVPAIVFVPEEGVTYIY